MTKYYKIPMTERIIGTSFGSLYKLLRERCPKLHDREIGRLALKHGSSDVSQSELKEQLTKYNQETSAMYELLKIPEFIIAVDNNVTGIVEISSSIPLEVTCKEFLPARKISEEEAKQYVEKNPNYSEIVSNFFVQEKAKELNKSTKANKGN